MCAKHGISFILSGIIIGLASLVLIKATLFVEGYFRLLVQNWLWLPLLLTTCDFIIIATLVKIFFNGAQGSGILQTLNALKLPATVDCQPYLLLRQDAMLLDLMAASIIAKMVATCVVQIPIYEALDNLGQNKAIYLIRSDFPR